MNRKVDDSNIPESLKQLQQWILWKTVTRDGKQTKVPFQLSGAEAKSNDPTTWNTFTEVWQRFQAGGFDGPGFVFSHYDPFTGIDLDGCRNAETGEIAQWAKDVILQLDTYAEVSPSQTGVKLWVEAASPFNTGKKRELDVEKVCDKQPGIEIYSHGRYFAVTGWRLQGPLEVEKRNLYFLRERFWPPTWPLSSPLQSDPVIERARKYVATMPPAVSGQGGHNATFSVACVLVLGFGLSESQALGLLQEYNQRCEPPWSEKELRHKVQSATQRPGERNYLRDADPSQWKTIKVPHYVQQSGMEKELRSFTLEEAARDYLAEVRSGKSMLLDLGLPDVDYAIGGGVTRGELVIIGARPSHGKSAVALQCMHSATSEGRPCLFISEEMSKAALGKRVIQFAAETSQEYWPTDNAVDRDLDAHFEKRVKCFSVESCATAERAANVIRQYVREHGVEVVAVDYATLLKSPGNSKYEQTSNTSILMRQVATECNVLLLLLCQLNREIENRKSFKPMMSDLRDSGQFEQDADVILFLCWPHVIDVKNDPHEYQVFVAKNRNRPINQRTVNCRFNPSRQRLEHEVLGEVGSFYEDEWVG